MIGGWIAGRSTVEAPCTIEIEQTPDSFHAYVELEGIEVNPGDSVLIHDAPSDVAFGEKIVLHRRATIVRAGPVERFWTRLTGMLEFSELYEVSFTSRRKL